MSIEQAVLETLKQLPLNQQQEVLDFTLFLKQKNSTLKPNTETHLTPEEKIEKWHKFITKLPRTSANLPDEALHRDSMYENQY